MSTSNFIRYGSNINIPIYYDGINRNVVLQYDNILELNTFSIDMISYNNLYIYQLVTLISDGNIYNFRITSINENIITLSCDTNIANIIFSNLFINDYMITSANNMILVNIETVKEIGQYYSNGIFYFKSKITLNKPRDVKIMGYLIKSKSDINNIYEMSNILPISSKDYDNNDIVDFSLVGTDSIYYKIAVVYKHKNIVNYSLFSEVINIKRSDINYVNF